MASIILKNVSKSFRDIDIIKNVNFTIEDGECAVLVGPSGCGKSTILRLICGLEDIDSGELFIGDRFVNDVPPASRGLAMVFQSYALYPHMTVFENMSFALTVRKIKKKDIETRVLETAKILKIDHLLERKPKDLSGGQRQRVAIGRAIVRNPFVFLFDEPLSNLDASLRCQMRYELAKLKAQLKTTMVYVTHDQAEAMTLADKIIVMRDGSVEQVGTSVEIYNSPKNTFVAKFIGSSEMNMLSVTFVENIENIARFKMESGKIFSVRNVDKQSFKYEEKYLFGIRPEDLTISNDNIDILHENLFEGIVSLTEDLGGEGFLHLDIGSNININAKIKNIHNVSIGEKVAISCNINRCYLFNSHDETIVDIKSM